mgnify:CR=1 FL=1
MLNELGLGIIRPKEQMKLTKKELGSVYTPTAISQWVASLLKDIDCKGTILDPAAGDGSLLNPFSKLGFKEIVGCDLIQSELCKIKESIKSAKTYNLDAFHPSKKLNILEFWEKFLKDHKVNTVVCNPPWGGKINLSQPQLQKEGLLLANGQFDSYELFIELMVKASSSGTKFAFIIPDSIFLPEHKPLRKFILDNCVVHGIYRLGEGVFENVFRGTVILLFEKGIPENQHLIKCFRLPKQWRTNIDLGHVTYSDATESLSHFVPQKRFSLDHELRFDIDASEEDITISKIEKVPTLDLRATFTSGRGIELSKTGKVVECEYCGTHYPHPRKPGSLFCRCGKEINVNEKNTKNIISKKATQGHVPLFVGEDISRYKSAPSRYIKSNVKGINYKINSLENPRILVRKTGIGINSTIVHSNILTNQVVFHFSLKNKSTPSFFLEYFQGILASRILLSYYLKKFGDNEWRSHAYVTQKIIFQLPIPLPVEGHPSWSNAKKIADLVRKKNEDEDSDNAIDFEIEKIVLDQYNLDQEDLEWSIKTLKNAQQLKLITLMLSRSEHLLNRKGTE